MPFSLDPDFGAALGSVLGGAPPPEPAPIGDIETRRAVTSQLFRLFSSRNQAISDVSSKDFTTKTADGKDMTLRWFTKNDSPAPGSAILYIHGGGMIALGLDDYDHIVKGYVSTTGVPFLVVDYRLAPESPAPGPVTDAYAGLAYLHEHASTLGVDPKRVAIMGDSAGGGIAASLTHYIRAKTPSPALPPLASQILIYPMLDDRNVDDHPLISPFLLWTPADNRTGWDALLSKERRGGFHVVVHEAPARMTIEDAKSLPPAYMEVGELDIFRDEDIEYALKLGKAGVSVELHVLTGLPHAYDLVSPDSAKVKRVLETRFNAIKSV